jgi:hypothetical protein
MHRSDRVLRSAETASLVKIIDRKGLEEAACQCYAVIQKFDGGTTTS